MRSDGYLLTMLCLAVIVGFGTCLECTERRDACMTETFSTCLMHRKGAIEDCSKAAESMCALK